MCIGNASGCKYRGRGRGKYVHIIPLYTYICIYYSCIVYITLVYKGVIYIRKGDFDRKSWWYKGRVMVYLGRRYIFTLLHVYISNLRKYQVGSEGLVQKETERSTIGTS